MQYFKKYRFNKFRKTWFLGKYIGIPIASFIFASTYFSKDMDEDFR